MRIASERKWLVRLLAILVAFTMVAAACGDDDDGGAQPDTTEDGEGQQGGTAVFAAEQWPECLNPITSCVNASWLHWSVLTHTLPRLMELDENNEFVPSPLLAGEPEITEDPFTVTYTLNPDAVWDDGTPITSEDIAFTVEAYLNTPGSIYGPSGYPLIESIDSSDPQTAVLTFSEPYADWWDLMGGNSAFVLKKSALEGAPIEEQMLDSLEFSGGPFVLESWSPEEAVLVRNENYWDEERMPMLDQVTMIPRTDTDTEITSLLSGESAAIFPQPSPGILDQVDRGNIDHEVGLGVVYEGLWPNHEEFPVNSPAVREALFYAVDRQAIVDTVIAQIVPDIPVLQCAGWVATVGEWCDETDFADITYDPDHSKEVLEADGWTLGSDGIYEKDGQKLEIRWATVSGNKRREDTQQLVIEQARQAGISLVVDNSDAGHLFENRLPQRDFVMAEYAQVASPDPTVTALYHCDQIPTEANNFAGQNYDAWCNEEVTPLLEESDRTIDLDVRLDLIQQIGDYVREDFVWLPLYQLPNLVIWDTDVLGGPVGLYASASYGGFGNMYDWFLQS